MARTPFKVEVLTPEGEVFNDEVEMVSTKTSVGSIGILANHQPLLGMLDPTELRLYKSDSEVLRFAQGEGFLQMSGTHALVLVDEVFPVDELDAATLNDRLREAEQRAERAEDDSEEQRRPLLHSLVASGALPTAHATDDGVGLVYEGTELVEAVADRPGVAAYVVERQADGTVTETRLEPRLLS